MRTERIGSVLHGAYGDYYEQLVSLRYMKRKNPDLKIILFYANDLRMKELAVYDHSFAEEVHSHSEITTVPVDRFHQFQIRAEELRTDVLEHLPAEILSKFDRDRNLKPWHIIRKSWREDPDLCDLPLSDFGKRRLPEVEAENQIPPDVFDRHFTVGFLWRYRRPGGAISAAGQPASELLYRERSILFTRLVEEFNAHILVCGMGIKTTDENRDRTDNKYDSRTMDLPAGSVTYLQGLSWGLELETQRRCDLSVVMASGFSEALWLKRRGRAIIAVDTPRDYIRRQLWNRMPFFNLLNPNELAFQLRQPHTAERVYKRLARKGLLPKAAGSMKTVR